MTAAYTVISNEGYYIKPTIIKEIIDNHGNIIYSNNYKNKKKVISKKIANNQKKMLKYKNKNFFPKEDVIGKTGTSNDNKDLWFIGERNNLTTGRKN